MNSIPDARNFEVGISVTTMDDSIPILFELDAPSLPERIPVFRPGLTSAMADFPEEGIRVKGHPCAIESGQGCR
jgi:DNA repair photolyase